MTVAVPVAYRQKSSSPHSPKPLQEGVDCRAVVGPSLLLRRVELSR